MLRNPLNTALSEQFSNSRFTGVPEMKLRSKSVVDYLLDFYELLFDSDAYDLRMMKAQERRTENNYPPVEPDSDIYAKQKEFKLFQRDLQAEIQGESSEEIIGFATERYSQVKRRMEAVETSSENKQDVPDRTKVKITHFSEQYPH